MNKRNVSLTTLLLAAFAWACAGTPGPGDAGYPFNLSGTYDGEILVEGMAFPTSLDLQTGPGGEVRGEYRVGGPASMDGEVEGSLVADTLRLQLAYVNPMDGCGGTLEGTGVVEEGGGAFAGRVRVNDSCAGYLAGRFSFKK